jgi:CheY-like chemotaxis protein
MCHVLIIEDEPLVAEVLRCLLEDEGATSFDYADTEEEAVRVAVEHRPDLITSDVNLIAGTGPRTVATIHNRLGDIPVIFITATPEACDPCSPPGCVLSKPVDSSKLAQAYHELTAS